MQEQLLQWLKDHPVLMFVLCILGAVGGWISNLPDWSQALSTQGIGSLLLTLASVTGAGIGSSIIKRLSAGVGSNGK